MPPSSSDGLPPLREVIAEFGLAAKKSLGQNFLLDLNLTARIARAAGAAEGGVFYEVGPGPGGLTRALLACGAERVVAVERDERCLPALAQIAAAWPGKLEVICGDAMELDAATLLPDGARIAANLPYNVGTALLIKWLTGARAPEVGTGSGQRARPNEEARAPEVGTGSGQRARPNQEARAPEVGTGSGQRARPNQEARAPEVGTGSGQRARPKEKPQWPPFWRSCTLMFQKEVAQRIVARPGTEHFGRLAVLAGWRATAKILFDVPRQAFVPPPKITSSVVRLEPRPTPLAPCALADLERVTAAAFGQRRKMLRQSLKGLAPDAEARIAAAGIAPTERPEELTVEQFAALARAFA